MGSLVEMIKKNTVNLTESEIKGLLGLLYRVSTEKGLTNNELIQLTGIPKQTLRQFLTAIKDYLVPDTGNVDNSNRLKLNTTGMQSFRDQANFYFRWNSLDVVTDSEDPNSNSAFLTQKLKQIRTKDNLTGTSAEREYDQFYATEATSIRKYEIALKHNSIHNKSIALLGDDDLISIVMGLAAANKKDSDDASSEGAIDADQPANYKEILVIDIDERILKNVETIAKEENLRNIKTLHHDIREEIPPQYKNKFDTVITDPPYTRWGTHLFLNTALKLLKNTNESTVYLYFGASQNEPFKYTKIQEIITSQNLVIKEKLLNFAQYNGAESIGSNSSLYILKPTSKSLPTNEYMGQEIYTFENSRDEKFPYVDHVTAKLSSVPAPFFAKGRLQKELGKFCNVHKLKVVETVVTKFKGGGMTITMVLANSNLVVHTWPEKSALHVDLITCEPIHRKNDLIFTLASIFQTKYVNLKIIE